MQTLRSTNSRHTSPKGSRWICFYDSRVMDFAGVGMDPALTAHSHLRVGVRSPRDSTFRYECRALRNDSYRMCRDMEVVLLVSQKTFLICLNISRELTYQPQNLLIARNHLLFQSISKGS